MRVEKILKKINLFFGRPSFWVLLLILITSIVFIPALKMEFWWVDDGWDILISQKIINSIIHLNPEWLDLTFNEPGGRLRVVYWLYQAFEYLIGGNNPTIHFIIHYFVVLVAACLIFRTVLHLTKSGFSAFFSSILYVLIPVNTENIFRLGPQEPLLGLFLIASIYFLLQNKTYLSIIFLLFGILTKENGFVLWIPILFYYITKRFVIKKRDKSLEKYIIWGLIFTIPVILNTLLRRSGYSGFYTFEISKIFGHFISYLFLINEAFFPLIPILFFSFVFRLLIIFRNGEYKKHGQQLLIEMMFILFFLVFIIVQSPWTFVLNRYVMPATIGLVIFMGMEIDGVKKYLIRIKKTRALYLLSTIFVLYLLSFIWINSAHVFLSGQLSAHQTSFIQSLYKSLAKEVPSKGTILLNFRNVDSTKELVVETALHLQLLYNRPDIKVDYLDFDHIPETSYLIVGTPQVVEQYTEEQIEKNIRNYKKDESLAKNDKYIVLTTPVNLFKQIIKKIYNLLVNKFPFTSDGIYTFYYSQDYWYKYYVDNKFVIK